MNERTDTTLGYHKPAASRGQASTEGLLPGARVRESVGTRMADHRRLRRRRRLSQLRGLSAKRLSERRRLLRQAGLS